MPRMVLKAEYIEDSCGLSCCIKPPKLKDPIASAGAPVPLAYLLLPSAPQIYMNLKWAGAQRHKPRRIWYSRVSDQGHPCGPHHKALYSRGRKACNPKRLAPRVEPSRRTVPPLAAQDSWRMDELERVTNPAPASRGLPVEESLCAQRATQNIKTTHLNQIRESNAHIALDVRQGLVVNGPA